MLIPSRLLFTSSTTTTRSLLLLLCFVGNISLSFSHTICDTDYDCTPNGVCSPDLKCVCETGYFGELCADSCPIRCQNGGQCIMDGDDHGGLVAENNFYCQCPSTHTGSLCQERKASAAASLTNNNNTAGQKVGIALTTILIAVAVLGAAMVLYRRRRRFKRRYIDDDNDDEEEEPKNRPKDVEDAASDDDVSLPSIQ